MGIDQRALKSVWTVFLFALAVFVIYGLALTEIASVLAGHMATWRMIPTWFLQAALLGLFAGAYHYPRLIARRAAS